MEEAIKSILLGVMIAIVFWGEVVMADNEKRILVLEVNPDCKTLKFDCDPFDEEDVVYCDKNGKYVRITEKDCAKCKSPVLAGLTRAEAVRIMTKVIFRELEPCLKPFHKVPKEKRGCIATAAEAALDELLGKAEEKCQIK